MSDVRRRDAAEGREVSVSRYVHVTIPRVTLDDAAAALQARKIAFERPKARVTLDGSLECAGEPVDLRVEAGILESVEDFGFVQQPDGVVLVCGELDATRLREALAADVSHAAVIRAAAESGLRVETESVSRDGARRVVLVASDDE